ncbi:hypothetical protein FAZ69_08500 [Trinickia terrae]|uniref:Zinc finger CHC2-type domain-containing protein n=1 Tax=Trinickia terrae TaxID=2571161 RepID=A0A4U1I9S9_9BURK|nr:CHC2 zinc finger domain-containing protein [Trinickia terrae]TKC90177.1 hypothetical protein FAZ69_08500 [Trinickia terrae]
MFEPGFLEQVRIRSDLVGTIGRTVKLGKAGKEYLGVCPFHAGTAPSFTVSGSRQFYHCFGCGAHGDVIRWEMDYGGLGYVDAVEKLARGAGLPLPEQAATADANGEAGSLAGLPKPDPNRSAFYRQYALLCALDMTMILEVPEALVDDFASLISGWFACAPADMKERIVALSSVRNGALRRVLGSALEGTRERAALMHRVQLRDEADAITDVTYAGQERVERPNKAVERFAA